jgi:hypothetical protein
MCKAVKGRSLPKLLVATCVSVLLAGCGSGYGGGSSTAGGNLSSGSGGTLASGDGSTVIGVQCTESGLASVDLAGQCRATPQATMGALEAVSG